MTSSLTSHTQLPLISDDHIARGAQALTLLDNVATRNSIVDELMEVGYKFVWKVVHSAISWPLLLG
jgi:uncharacterized protein with HEPN domain